MRWMWRHRLLSLLGFGLVGAGVAWARTWGAQPPPPPQSAPPPAAPAAPAREPIADLDTPAIGLPTAEIAAELAREPGSAAPDGVVVPGVYPGSAEPLPGGARPSPEYTVKAKVASMRCHGPSSPYYQRTKADVWFCSEADAVAAGFRAWNRKR